MRHRKRASKLGRTSAHRLALYRNLVTSLLEEERIQTTDAKAKQVRRIADRMITLGKRGTLHARRRALRVIRRREVAAKVFDDLAERYRERPGGYTRVLKLGSRGGDAAPLSLVELVEGAPVPSKGQRKAGAKKGAEAAKARGKKDSEKTTKKSAAKKTAAKKTTKKASTGKTSTKKASTSKASTKKAPTKKTSSKKASRKKSD